MRRRQYSFFLIVLMLLITGSVRAQDVYTLQPDSRLWIDGSSNRSDWTVHAKQLDGSIDMVLGETPEVQAVRVVIPINEVVSDKSVIMDRNMHNALNADTHPEATFELVRADLTPGEGDAFTLSTAGNLTLNGVTQEITLDINGTREGDQVRFTGSYPLDMTDFDLRPPTAAFGAWRVAKDVVVHFDLLAGPGE